MNLNLKEINYYFSPLGLVPKFPITVAVNS